MSSPSRTRAVHRPHLTSNDEATSGYAIRRFRPVERPLELDDGSVVVPAALAGDVLRTLMVGLTARVRADGGELGPDVRRLLYALHDAEQRAAEPFESDTAPIDSASGTVLAGADTVGSAVSVQEAAALLGCSTGYVRRLARTGTLAARRIGARAWAIDRATLDDYRHGGTNP